MVISHKPKQNQEKTLKCRLSIKLVQFRRASRWISFTCNNFPMAINWLGQLQRWEGILPMLNFLDEKLKN
jgi:hypothetical protein